MTPLASKATIWAVLLAAVVTVGLVPAVGAQGNPNNNQGTIKVHDDAVADPDQRNEPHVDCDFWVEGFNMQDDSGTLVFFSWPPTGDKSVVEPDGDLTWTGTPETDGSGHHFLAGPFSGLESGHYRVEVYDDDGHTGGGDQFAKAKMFWVECEDDEVVEVDECPPTELVAIAKDDGSIEVTLTSDDAEAEFNVYRSADGGDLEYVATLSDGDTFVDTETEVGVTYDYVAVLLQGDIEGDEVCALDTATAIPIFPSAVIGAVALMGCVGAYTVMRRRSS